MLSRYNELTRWIEERNKEGLWPYELSVSTSFSSSAKVLHPSQNHYEGINFTSVDYLGLSNHPEMIHAATDAMYQYRSVHSKSSGPLMGNSKESDLLRNELTEFTGLEHVFLCPTGWAAGFGSITGIIRKHDFVVLDEYAHNCLQTGAVAVTKNITKFKHLDNNDLEAKLSDIRSKNPDSGILVATEGLFSMDGDYPDFIDFVTICKKYNAFTLVDVAHDFGCMGTSGKGTLGLFDVLNDIDVVIGSFSKTFATNGGFIATNNLSISYAIRAFGGSYTYSTAISPQQVAVARKALSIVNSQEGERLRLRLQENINYFKARGKSLGLQIHGSNTPIIPIIIGKEEIGRIANSLSLQKGIIATVLEFPVVSSGKSRFRISMTPYHTNEDMDRALKVIKESIEEAIWIFENR